jgi:hypothetical protein
LDNLRTFIDQPIQQVIEPYIPLVVVPSTRSVAPEMLENYCNRYIAGYAGRQILKNCNFCSNVPLDENVLIIERQYEKGNLIQPNSQFGRVFRTITLTAFMLENIPKMILSYGIKRKLRPMFLNDYFADVNTLFCVEHKDVNVNSFVDTCINVILFSYLTKLNRILNGKDLRYINQDHIFRLAFEKYSKTRKR